MPNLFLLVLLLLVSITFTNVVFAATYDINMPTGSASPDAPYFWQNEKSGAASGDIEIFIGDTVVWRNGDQAKHTVTSGTPDGGPDGIFGSADFLSPGQSYQFTFDKKGQYPYYCLIHPWMIGTVFVIDGFKVLPEVGKTIGDGTTAFDVEYQSERVLSLVMIDQEQKLMTFELVGTSHLDNNTLKIRLPSELIDGPFVVIIDGTKITDFEHFKENDLNTISIPLHDDSKILTIIGTTIVPEFGSLSIIILAISIVSIIVVRQKSGSYLKII